MSRTPLAGRLRLLARAAYISKRTGVPADELLEFGRSRRRFMQATAGGLAAAALGASCASTGKTAKNGDKPRVVIVGAGIAGLHCAHVLKKAGITASVYEAADRVGGRMFTKTDLLNPGQTVELGGEFVDTSHADMMSLCKEFKLDLLDTDADVGLIATAYHFEGRHYTDREVLDALKPYVQRMGADAALLDLDASDERLIKLDRTSISGYLDQLKVGGWLRKLLEVAFVTEYGREADEQSACNMLSLIGLDTSSDRWEAFGEGAERYKVKGGSQRVIEELAKKVQGQIETARKLESMTGSAGGFDLSFSGGLEVKADYVVLALPFTLLREVKLNVELPAGKRRAIDELGYGTNAKLMLGTSTRPWRKQGYAGDVFSDVGFQLAWDNARMQPGLAGGLTLYSGGSAGLEVGKGSPREQVDRLLPGLEKVFPDTTWAETGRVFRMHWPTHAFTKASYSCYLPGQWTTISGFEQEPVGKLYFAGEHCSSDFQGYMNGGAETGRVAADGILAAKAK
jgi:monoamine oxidase